MGDRVVVLFKDQGGYAPGVYLHWLGHAVFDILKEATPRLRKGDAGYSAARFCGAACARNPEVNYGIGLVEAPSADVDWEKYSPGDRGVVVVDCDTGNVEHVCGYKDEEVPAPKSLALVD